MEEMKLLLRASLPFAILTLAQGQDLPNGPGKEVTTKICGACHEAGVVVKYRSSKDDWQGVVEDMRGRGADGSDDDFKNIINYLSHYFGPEIHINKASAADLASQIEISPTEAAVIVQYRDANGDFKDLPSLQKVPGIDMTKIDPIKQRIVFN